MARSLLRTNVRDRSGNAIENARVLVYETGTVTPVADLYLASSGGSPQDSLLSNAQGEAIGYVDTNRAVKVRTTDNSNQAFYPATPSSLLSFDDFDEDPVPTTPLEITPTTGFYKVGQTGTLTVSGGNTRDYIDFAGTLGTFRFSVGTAPTGAAVIVDVRLNGTTIFASPPQIAVSTFTVTAAPSTTAVVAGDYLTYHITQVGSTVAGANLVISWSLEAT